MFCLLQLAMLMGSCSNILFGLLMSVVLECWAYLQSFNSVATWLVYMPYASCCPICWSMLHTGCSSLLLVLCSCCLLFSLCNMVHQYCCFYTKVDDLCSWFVVFGPAVIDLVICSATGWFWVMFVWIWWLLWVDDTMLALSLLAFVC